MNKKQNLKTERFTVKNLPDTEQPYEKCMNFGAAALSDAELLAVIIRCGSQKERSVDLACRILNLYEDRGICSLYHADLKTLMSLHGIGKVKAVQILCVAELAKRMAKAEAKSRISFSNPQDAAYYLMEDMRHLEHEETVAVFLDAKMNLIRDKVIFKGTVNTSMFEPREILVEALRAGAVNLIMLHNHPSGDPSPSNADVSATVRLCQACKTVGLRLFDHIIIGDNRYLSMRESGII